MNTISNLNLLADLTFKEAPDARNSKEKDLQPIPDERKVYTVALKKNDIVKIGQIVEYRWTEGLQERFFSFFLLASYEVDCREGTAV